MINSSIVKLGKLTTANTVYRGISGGVLPEEFCEANEYGVCGGMAVAWRPHGSRGAAAWQPYGSHMAATWQPHGSHMVGTWSHMVVTWQSPGRHM